MPSNSDFKFRTVSGMLKPLISHLPMAYRHSEHGECNIVGVLLGMLKSRDNEPSSVGVTGFNFRISNHRL